MHGICKQKVFLQCIINSLCLLFCETVSKIHLLTVPQNKFFWGNISIQPCFKFSWVLLMGCTCVNDPFLQGLIICKMLTNTYWRVHHLENLICLINFISQVIKSIHNLWSYCIKTFDLGPSLRVVSQWGGK